MSDTAVAKRYAKALLEVARSQNIMPQVEEDLRSAVQGIQQNSEFAGMLAHPNVDMSVKLGLLKNVFEGKIADAVYRTITLLVERRRESLLPVLLADYVQISNEALGQANAVVTTPAPLTEEEAKLVAERFGAVTGKTIRIENAIDPSLLGGLTVRIGDRLYDGSLSGKLSRLQKSLNTSQAL